jgi:hypothetical protein
MPGFITSEKAERAIAVALKAAEENRRLGLDLKQATAELLREQGQRLCTAAALLRDALATPDDVAGREEVLKAVALFLDGQGASLIAMSLEAGTSQGAA